MDELIRMRETLMGLGFLEVPGTPKKLYFTNQNKDNIQLKYHKEKGSLTLLNKYGVILKEFQDYKDFRSNYP